MPHLTMQGCRFSTSKSPLRGSSQPGGKCCPQQARVMGRVVTAPANTVACAAGIFGGWTSNHAVAASLPDHVQGYLSLLADSTTSQGGMSKHLVKIMAQGAGWACKMDVLDTVADLVADAGTEKLVDMMKKPPGKCSGWAKLRAAVRSAIMFKAAGKSCTTRDDSTLQPDLHPAHLRALKVLVSVIMSGAISSAVHAVTPDAHGIGGGAAAVPPSPFQPQHAPTALVATTAAVGGAEQGGMHAATSMLQAPTLRLEHSLSLRSAPSMKLRAMPSLRADGSAALAGTGGMAATTALKLLRADSKGVSAALELQDILDPLLKSVEECGDELVGRTAAARMPDSRFGKGMRAANGATAVV